jgi:hypothetical protein
MNDLTTLEVDDARSTLAEFSDEKPLAGQIDRQVVDATFHIAQRNLDFELQQRRGRLFGIRLPSDEAGEARRCD